MNNAQKFLKETRSELMLTQPQLASVSGYSLSDIKNYEYGRARVPGDLVLKLIAMRDAQKKRDSIVSLKQKQAKHS